ncbi:823_t:CDS:2 [Funneliformis geosporum]|uniref:4074_t:CDS:1 n=1 Tax=Funneliformis geosporum TaxID=1117311 RepID=A0A9W4WQ34_9GLOM|nr:4074_t:CDS:2 [Funneliformis geosporum]CAI2170838.1 823_t:CDS:2 [Funneliformis geosporum]
MNLKAPKSLDILIISEPRLSVASINCDNDINLIKLALNLQQDIFEPVEQNTQYEFEETNNPNINLGIDADAEKEIITIKELE